MVWWLIDERILPVVRFLSYLCLVWYQFKIFSCLISLLTLIEEFIVCATLIEKGHPLRPRIIQCFVDKLKTKHLLLGCCIQKNSMPVFLFWLYFRSWGRMCAVWYSNVCVCVCVEREFSVKMSTTWKTYLQNAWYRVRRHHILTMRLKRTKTTLLFKQHF